ncbi:MAG: hypothetical protein ABH846_04535, partial [Patescibacteria group bacterium]
MYSPNFLKTTIKRKSPFIVLLVIAIFITSFYAGNFIFSGEAYAATKYWDGGGADNNWNTAANWFPDGVPGMTDDIIFDDAYSVKDCTINAMAFVNSIDIQSGYTGTITANNLVYTSSTFSMADGAFNGGAQTIQFVGGFDLSGGTFTSTSTTYPTGLTVNNDFTISGGSFVHNSGGVAFSTGTGFDVDVNTSVTFYDLYIVTSGTQNINIASDDTLITTGTLTLSNGQIMDGTIEAQGSYVHGVSWDGGTGIVHLTGTSTRNITFSSGTMPGIHIDGPNTTLTVTGSSNRYFEGDVSISQGTLNSSALTGELKLKEDFTLSGGTYNAGPATEMEGDWTYTSGTYTHNNGAVYMAYSIESDTDDHTISGNATFYDLAVKNYTSSVGYVPTNIYFQAGATTTILNDAVFEMVQHDPMLTTYRTTIASTSGGTAANIDFQGSASFFNTAIQDINVVGSAIDCNVRCVDNGGNTDID